MKLKGWAVYTDGACSGNPGPGGWAAIVISPEKTVRELGGGAERTTNNRMEMAAVLHSLRYLREKPGPVLICTDSTYVIQGLTKWIRDWKRRGWKRADGEEVLNRDAWERLDELVSERGKGLTWRQIKGHSGDPGNERCDAIAVAFSKGKKVEFFEGPLKGYPHAPLKNPPPVFTKKGPAFYLSVVEGQCVRHKTWEDCSYRVKGRSGCKFRKVHSEEEAEFVLKGWGVKP